MVFTFSKCDLYCFVQKLALTADIDSLKVEIINLGLFQVMHDPFTAHIDTLYRLRLPHNPASYAGCNKEPFHFVTDYCCCK
jgi:hypothetical protein